jgi:hypothetical protein
MTGIVAIEIENVVAKISGCKMSFFETLEQILSFDSETCQGPALHGLGHLHHPDTPALIDRYIKQHPSLKQEWKSYALAAAKFEVL